jgi:4,5-dihydroxyphthalate decarboxylase
MSKLILHTAIGNYGHTAQIKNGNVGSARFEMQHVDISPVPMIFRRMVRDLEFDVAEMALATYICSNHFKKKFTALPIFLTRGFYHSNMIYRQGSQIVHPKDLEGKRVGVRSYTFTPGVWSRGILSSYHGVDLDSITWVLSGDEHVEEFKCPANVLTSDTGDLYQMLTTGEVDAVIGATTNGSPEILPLFTDPESLDKDWYSKNHIYPISHVLVVKDELLHSNPWLGQEIVDVFNKARSGYLNTYNQYNSLQDPTDHSQMEFSKIVGANPLNYSFPETRETLTTFISYNLEQKLIPEAPSPEELFFLD